MPSSYWRVVPVQLWQLRLVILPRLVYVKYIGPVVLGHVWCFRTYLFSSVTTRGIAITTPSTTSQCDSGICLQVSYRYKGWVYVFRKQETCKSYFYSASLVSWCSHWSLLWISGGRLQKCDSRVVGWQPTHRAAPAVAASCRLCASPTVGECEGLWEEAAVVCQTGWLSWQGLAWFSYVWPDKFWVIATK